RGFLQDHSHNPGPARAQGHPYADFIGAPGHTVRKHSIQADGGEQQSNRSENAAQTGNHTRLEVDALQALRQHIGGDGNVRTDLQSALATLSNLLLGSPCGPYLIIPPPGGPPLFLPEGKKNPGRSTPAKTMTARFFGTSNPPHPGAFAPKLRVFVPAD